MSLGFHHFQKFVNPRFYLSILLVLTFFASNLPNYVVVHDHGNGSSPEEDYNERLLYFETGIYLKHGFSRDKNEELWSMGGLRINRAYAYSGDNYYTDLDIEILDNYRDFRWNSTIFFASGHAEGFVDEETLTLITNPAKSGFGFYNSSLDSLLLDIGIERFKVTFVAMSIKITESEYILVHDIREHRYNVYSNDILIFYNL